MPNERETFLGTLGEAGFGTGEEMSDFASLPLVGGSPFADPLLTETPRPVHYPSNGSVSYGTNTSGLQSNLVFAGFDVYGRPIYEAVREPVYRESYDLNPGWNSRAYVNEPVNGTMYLSFEAGNVVGAVVGLTASLTARAGYEDIILGWMILDGVAFIVARGQLLMELDVATTAPDPGKYNRTVDQLTMVKTGNRVEFFLTSQEGQIGQTKIAEAFMNEPVTYVSAALYLGGDTIHNEVLEFPDIVDVQLPALQCGIFEQADSSYVMVEIPSLTTDIYENDSSVLSVTIPALSCLISDSDVAVVETDLPAITCYIESYSDFGESPEFNYVFTATPALNCLMMVYDEEFESFNATLPALGCFIAEQEDAAVIQVETPALTAYILEEQFADRLTLISFGYTAFRMIARPTVAIVFNSSAEVVGVVSLDEIHSLLLESEVNASSTATLTDVIREILLSTMSAADVASLQRDGMSVWTLHMDSMGSTRYEGYDFNSFMTIDGKTYGVNATGIHRLEGTTDDGAPIPASVDFGSLSFGSNNRKSLPYVYVGMSSSGKTVLKIESDGGTYYYTARDSTELMKTHRFEPGRGLRSTFYGLSLQTDGEAFDLHNIDFQPVELKRSL